MSNESVPEVLRLPPTPMEKLMAPAPDPEKDPSIWLDKAIAHYAESARLAERWGDSDADPAMADSHALWLYQRAAREGQQGILAAGIANALLSIELLT